MLSPQVSITSKQYTLVSLAKLSTRLQAFDDENKIKVIIDQFGTHLNIDLQQRGVEFLQLFRDYSHLRSALLEKMPPMNVNRVQQNGNGSYDFDSNITTQGELMDGVDTDPEPLTIKNPKTIKINKDSNALLDLLGDDIVSNDNMPSLLSNTQENSLINNVTASNNAIPTAIPTTGTTNNLDLLDLLGGIDTSPTAPSVFPTLLSSTTNSLDSENLNIISPTTNNINLLSSSSIIGGTTGIDNLLNSGGFMNDFTTSPSILNNNISNDVSLL